LGGSWNWNCWIYFMTIWNILRLFAKFYRVCGNLVYFSHFGMFGPIKIWQPCSEPTNLTLELYKILNCSSSVIRQFLIDSFLNLKRHERVRSDEQGCQIFLGTIYQNGKNIPNEPKIYKMILKYTKWP
jgi:hypothetical protein